MEIKPMTLSHLDEVLAIEALCFSDPWSESSFLGELASPISTYVVAEEGEQILGYGGMQRILDESYITNIAVAPFHRRKGVARAILTALVQCAREGQGAMITLECRVSNHPALALYQSMGFGEAGRRKGFYEHPREDALLLTRWFDTEEERL